MTHQPVQPPLASAPKWAIAVVIVLCLVTFAPALDNPFIADDYVFLEKVDSFPEDPFFLFDEAPLNYRMTTFLIFFLLKGIAGYTPAVFYAVTILIHVANCLLLRKLLLLLGRDRFEASFAAVFFAVFHGPQEAVLWSVAMGESLLGLCILSILILWLRDRYAAALLVYLFALFTKESAPLAWIVLVLVLWYTGRKVWSSPFLLFTLMTGGFGVFFVWMWAGNSFIQEGAYDFGPRALPVLALSIHRLLWPWFYILVVMSRISRGSWISVRILGLFLGLWVLAMSPYVFLTYANALPSRHLYVASLVMAASLAYVLQKTPHLWLRQAFLIAFVSFNIGFLWVRKDAQFEDRGAPTEALIAALRKQPPVPVLVVGFAYPYPEIARAAALAVPGWRPDLVRVDGTGETCGGCPELHWDAEAREYKDGP